MTTREYAQTIELLELHGIAHEVVGPATAVLASCGKGRAMAGRLHALRGFAKRSRLRHRALPRVARAPARRAVARDPVLLRVRLRVRPRPARLGCRPHARRRPRRDPAGPARPARRPRAQGAPLPGAQGGVLPPRLRAGSDAFSTRLGLDREAVLVVVRTPPDVSLYHRHGNPLFADVLERLGADDGVQRSSSPERAAPRNQSTPLPSLVVPSTRSTPRASSHSPTSSSPPAGR